MRRVDNPDRGIKSLYLINNGRCQLKVNVIQMHDIRMKILQNNTNLLPRLFGINDFERISERPQPPLMKIDRFGIAVRMISHDPAFMFHAEILHFMPHLTKLFADPEDICLGPSVRVQEFIDD